MSTISLVTGMPVAAKAEENLPPGINKAVEIFCKVHRFWRGYQRTKELTSSIDRFGAFLVGYIAAQTCAQIKPLRITAEVLQIAAYSIECIKQKKRFTHSYRQLKEIWSHSGFSRPNQYVSYKRIWFLSPLTRLCWERKCNARLSRIAELSKAILEFFSELFSLSMRWMDLWQALKKDSEVNKDAVVEICINCCKIMNHLIENREEINEILKSLGTSHRISLITEPARCLVASANIVWQIWQLCKIKTIEMYEWLKEEHRNDGKSALERGCHRIPTSKMPSHISTLNSRKKSA